MDESILEANELGILQKLKSHIGPGEQIQHFTEVRLNQQRLILALTDSNFYLFFGALWEKDPESIIRFQQGFVKQVKYSPWRSELKLFFAEDVIKLKIPSGYWKINAEDMAREYQSLPLQSKNQDAFLEDLKMVEDVFGVIDSIRAEVNQLSFHSDEILDFDDGLFDRILSYRISAAIIFFSLLINLIPLIFNKIQAYQSNLVPALFFTYFGILLWQKREDVRISLLVFSVFSLFYFGDRFFRAGAYLDLYFNAIFTIALGLSLIGKPSRQRVIAACIFYSLLALGVALVLVVKDIFLAG